MPLMRVVGEDSLGGMGGGFSMPHKSLLMDVAPGLAGNAGGNKSLALPPTVNAVVDANAVEDVAVMAGKLDAVAAKSSVASRTIRLSDTVVVVIVIVSTTYL